MPRRKRKNKKPTNPRLLTKEQAEEYIQVNKEMWINEPLLTDIEESREKNVNLLKMIAENMEIKGSEKAIYYYDREQLPPIITFEDMRFAFEFDENKHKLTSDVRKFIEKAMKKYGYTPLYGK